MIGVIKSLIKNCVNLKSIYKILLWCEGSVFWIVLIEKIIDLQTKNFLSLPFQKDIK